MGGSGYFVQTTYAKFVHVPFTTSNVYLLHDLATIERWNKGYFDVWIYLKNPVTNKMCCLIVGDMRHLVGLPERPLEAVCYRRVEHLDDYKVSNRHARLDDVVERVLEICA